MRHLLISLLVLLILGGCQSPKASKPSKTYKGTITLKWEETDTQSQNAFKSTAALRLAALNISETGYAIDFHDNLISVSITEKIDSAVFNQLPRLLSWNGEFALREVYPLEQVWDTFLMVNDALIRPVDSSLSQDVEKVQEDTTYTSLEDQLEAEKNRQREKEIQEWETSLRLRPLRKFLHFNMATPELGPAMHGYPGIYHEDSAAFMNVLREYAMELERPLPWRIDFFSEIIYATDKLPRFEDDEHNISIGRKERILGFFFSERKAVKTFSVNELSLSHQQDIPPYDEFYFFSREVSDTLLIPDFSENKEKNYILTLGNEVLGYMDDKWGRDEPRNALFIETEFLALQAIIETGPLPGNPRIQQVEIFQ